MRFVCPDAPVLVFPPKAGTHVWHGHRPSPVWQVSLDFGDMFDYLATDPDTRAILLYLEGITHRRKYMSAARAASRTKPVLVLKAGRSTAAADAATSHTLPIPTNRCRIRHRRPR
jgi:hypothetical protein